MTAAERQRKRRAQLAAERPPQHDPRDAELSRLRSEVARLQAEVARLQARAAEKAPADDDELRQLGPESLNPKWLLKDIHGAIDLELERRRKACGTIDRKVAKLAGIAPDKATELRRKIEMLANDAGATEDERDAARAALERSR